MRILPHGLVSAREKRPVFLALDVEVADFAEIEQALVEARPLVHVAAMDVVREVVDERQARRLERLGRDRPKVHVVDGVFAVPVDEIDERSPDADDRGNVEFHRPDAVAMRLRAERDRALERRRRIPYAKRHGAHGRPMRLGELLRERVGLGIDDEVDVAL